MLAGCGLHVAKHGNRAASSLCGSADVLEACGFSIDTPPEIARLQLERERFTFLFAPRYHPAAKEIAPVRRELGVRSIFNILGPLANPAGANCQNPCDSSPSSWEKHDGESKCGRQSQSTEPSRPTKAAVCRSPMTA